MPIGRSAGTLEAQFQWSHARDLKPEPEELVKIKQKLASGLQDETSAATAQEEAGRRLSQVRIPGNDAMPGPVPGIGVLPGSDNRRARRI